MPNVKRLCHSHSHLRVPTTYRLSSENRSQRTEDSEGKVSRFALFLTSVL